MQWDRICKHLHEPYKQTDTYTDSLDILTEFRNTQAHRQSAYTARQTDLSPEERLNNCPIYTYKHLYFIGDFYHII